MGGNCGGGGFGRGGIWVREGEWGGGGVAHP